MNKKILGERDYKWIASHMNLDGLFNSIRYSLKHYCKDNNIDQTPTEKDVQKVYRIFTR